MNRAEATERVQKLLALADPARGGTPAECETAAGKARQLIERFGLDVSQHEQVAGKKRTVFVDNESFEVQWAFDINTGAASKNVTVHRYDNRGSWLIEVDMTRPGGPIGAGSRSQLPKRGRR